MAQTSSRALSVPNREHAAALLTEMLRIRRFEEESAALYQEGKIRGFLHLYIGEEAVAVGAMQALTPDDGVVSTYREHGHALARGISMERLMAELYGKVTGCSKGRGGSMHFYDASRRFYGGNAIVAGGLPLAVGIALADRMQGRGRVTACFFGEGAVDEGEFHESMNLAALWKLPILFLCENNLYSLGTPFEIAEAQTDLCAKAASYKVPGTSVDGMDVLAVEDAAQRAAATVRSEGGPRFVEFRTYRFRGHSMADPELYRKRTEVEEWMGKDPIAAFQKRTAEWGLLSDQDVKGMDGDVRAEVSRAIAFAEQSPWEPVEDLQKYVMTGLTL